MEKLHRFNIVPVITIVFILFSPIAGTSEDHYVNTPALLQQALNTSIGNREPDTIHVAAGTYNLSSTLIYDMTPATTGEQYPLTIIGDGAGTTILDGGTIPGTNSYQYVMVIDCTSGNFGSPGILSDANCDITISEMTFQNGTDGGLYFNAFEADLVVEDSIFHDNGEASDGGAIYADTWANITVRRNTFSANTVEYYGGGVYLDAQSTPVYMSVPGSIWLEDNTFSGNTITDEGDGAGAYVSANNLTITGNTFHNNVISGYAWEGGAGLYAWIGAFSDTDSSLVVSGNTFTNNINNGGSAGAAYIDSQGLITITGNIFSDNESLGTDGEGGGLSVAAIGTGALLLSNNIFRNNSADEAGGAYVATGSYSGPAGPITISNNIFINNSTVTTSDHSGNGGGLYVDINNTPTTVSLTNNTITGNTLSGPGGDRGGNGGGLHIRSFHNDTTIALYNNIIWGNSAVANGDDLYIDDDVLNDEIGSIITVHNNDYSDIFIKDGDNASFLNNINRDPLFVDRDNNDSHLLGTSPCIEAGDDFAPELPATDFEGDNRIINEHVDIGADEYDGIPIITIFKGDINDDKSVDLTDVILALQLQIGWSISQDIYVEADTDGDGKIGIADVIYLLAEISKDPP